MSTLDDFQQYRTHIQNIGNADAEFRQLLLNRHANTSRELNQIRERVTGVWLSLNTYQTIGNLPQNVLNRSCEILKEATYDLMQMSATEDLVVNTVKEELKNPSPDGEGLH